MIDDILLLIYNSIDYTSSSWRVILGPTDENLKKTYMSMNRGSFTVFYSFDELLATEKVYAKRKTQLIQLLVKLI